MTCSIRRLPTEASVCCTFTATRRHFHRNSTTLQQSRDSSSGLRLPQQECGETFTVRRDIDELHRQDRGRHRGRLWHPALRRHRKWPPQERRCALVTLPRRKVKPRLLRSAVKVRKRNISRSISPTARQ